MRALSASGDRLSPDQLSLEQQRRGGEGVSPPSSPSRAGGKGPATRAPAAPITRGVSNIRIKAEGILGYVGAASGHAATAAGQSCILDRFVKGMGGVWPFLTGRSGCGPATVTGRRGHRSSRWGTSSSAAAPPPGSFASEGCAPTTGAAPR